MKQPKDTTRRLSEGTHKEVKARAQKQGLSIKDYLTRLVEDIAGGQYDHLTEPLTDKTKLVRIDEHATKEASRHLVGTNKTLVQLIEDIHNQGGGTNER